MRLLILLGWVCACLGTIGPERIFSKVGTEVVLKPTVSAPITSIVWKYGPNLAVQYDKDGSNYYLHFKDRSQLNVSNGELTIQRLTLADTNSYTAEINNIVQNPIELKVLRPVPRPEIKVQDLTLSCTGDTSDAEPVTYSWSSENITSNVSKTMKITKDDCLKFFTCTMHNPVSEMESYRFQPCPPPHNIVGILVGVGLLVLLGVVIIGHKLKTKEWFFQKDFRIWKADFWKDTTKQSANSNGRGRDESLPMADE